MSKIGYNQGNNPFKKTEPNAFQKYIDLDGDGKDEWWEYGLEAASWVPTAFAVFGTSPSGPGAVAAGAATKAGVRQVLKKGVQLGNKWFAGSNWRRGATVGGSGYKTGYKINQVKKDSEMEASGFNNNKSSDIDPKKDATNILDNNTYKRQ